MDTRSPNIPDATEKLPTDAGLCFEQMQPPKDEFFELNVVVGDASDLIVWKMANPDFSREEKCLIDDSHKAIFRISTGPLANDPESTLSVLEIDYEASYDAHLRSLPLEGFGRSLYRDYAVKANEIAVALCKERGLKIVDHICSYPVFLATTRQSHDANVNAGVNRVNDGVRKIFQ